MAEIVAVSLRQQILNGDFTDDALPTQTDLMENFGVSGPSVREALRILEAEGLVTVRRGKVGGAEVHRPSGASAAYITALTLQGERTQMRELTDAVQLFEPHCAALCASREDRVEALAADFERNLAASAEVVGDGREFTHLAREFHALVVDHVTNTAIRLMVRSIVQVWTIQQETWAVEASHEGRYPHAGRQREVLESHRRIAERILAGQAQAAERAARRHLVATHEIVLADIGPDRLVDAVSMSAMQHFHRGSPTPS